MEKRRVTLTWEGKDKALEGLGAAPPAIAVEEHLVDQARPPDRMVRGDALDVARALVAEGLGGAADLVYLDPPYASGFDYTHEERFDGSATGRVTRITAYSDRFRGGPASYLDMLFPRLVAMKALLRATGSIWIQVDWRANHLVRSLCDEIFGRDRFLNEIVWRRAPNLGRQARSGQFGRTLDTIIVYGASAKTRLIPPERLQPVPPRAARRDPESGRSFTLAPRGDYTDASVARLESEGRIHRSASGKVSVKYWLEPDREGRLCRRQPIDALWADLVPLRHAPSKERTGYPTQKPRALLERILMASTPPDGLAIDLFAGSGTTGAAAARLGRRFILGDESAVAIATARSRLLRGGATALRLERCGPAEDMAPLAIAVAPHGDDEIAVRLCPRPGAEPVAWALDLSPHPDRPFCAAWHAERDVGRKPAPLPLTAVVRRTDALRARAYFVDGKVGQADAFLATEPLPEPISLLEAIS